MESDRSLDLERLLKISSALETALYGNEHELGNPVEYKSMDGQPSESDSPIKPSSFGIGYEIRFTNRNRSPQPHQTKLHRQQRQQQRSQSISLGRFPVNPDLETNDTVQFLPSRPLFPTHKKMQSPENVEKQGLVVSSGLRQSTVLFKDKRNKEQLKTFPDLGSVGENELQHLRQRIRALENLLKIQEESLMCFASTNKDAPPCGGDLSFAMSNEKLSILLKRWRDRVYEMMLQQVLTDDLMVHNQRIFDQKEKLFRKKINDVNSELSMVEGRLKLAETKVDHYRSIAQSFQRVNKQLTEYTSRMQKQIQNHQDCYTAITERLEKHQFQTQKGITHLDSMLSRLIKRLRNSLLIAVDNIEVLRSIPEMTLQSSGENFTKPLIYRKSYQKREITRQSDCDIRMPHSDEMVLKDQIEELREKLDMILQNSSRVVPAENRILTSKSVDSTIKNDTAKQNAACAMERLERLEILSQKLVKK